MITAAVIFISSVAAIISSIIFGFAGLFVGDFIFRQWDNPITKKMKFKSPKELEKEKLEIEDSKIPEWKKDLKAFWRNTKFVGRRIRGCFIGIVAGGIAGFLYTSYYLNSFLCGLQEDEDQI